ncbi:MAG: tripartite tricarboxylate transporter substrate binding protein [Rhizobiales bacterium]|nr:tripartite tricarboxylate transporter substrate binding protein [Hyphomicrobiales bacterium]MBO6697485.1 tripartite tricarboxylate transporter substrate binding protein [Hyphomicrobiales bacterium]MBO6736260.1 tripartite tricarboxylate transporter substrate binding protein [Hyphomicrobiales bacterium]MBO6912730.1 tripartite tricarboxylate transporter substrate binding protein [Hyphomicrobiales bacterium]MBO6953899.1 tripartite tricarboxylate transporter substrate binding protein [Hyphomicrob
MIGRRTLLGTFGAALLGTSLATGLGVASVQAQSFPEKPITLVVGFNAGGGTDTYARALAGTINDALGMPMVVVNQPGAAGMIAADFVAGQPADGYTLYMASAGSFLVKSMYDGEDAAVQPLEDMRILGQIGASIPGLLVPIDSPFAGAADLVAAAQADPDALRWSHPGRGSLFQLTGVAFLQANGIEVQDVPFQGGSRARNAVAGAQVDFGFMGVQLQNGFESQIRALGVAGSERDPANPDTPTFAEQGLPDVPLTNPQMIMAPGDLPDDVAAILAEAIAQTVSGETYGRLVSRAGLSVQGGSPEEARARLEGLQETLTPLVEATRE